MTENIEAAVEKQIDLGSGYFLMQLGAESVARRVRAGQFVMLGLPDIGEMLIRRPFSVARCAHGASGGPVSIEILYKVIGRYTGAFSLLKPGARLSVLGPLGRGFWLPPDDGPIEILLVAGGIGNAPFPLLLQGLGSRRAETTLFFGGKSRSDLTLLDYFGENCARVVTATEDGSLGHRGLITEPLRRHLEEPASGGRLVLSCGPHPMLRAVADVCAEHDVPCQVALEETMACGFGVCLGCVVPKRSPENEFDAFVRVCSEGPVFDAREIVL